MSWFGLLVMSMSECQFTIQVLFFETSNGNGKTFIFESSIKMDIIAID